MYLGGDAYSVSAIYVKEGTGSWKTYYIFRDYLGRGRSTVYLSKSAFVNTSYLKMTIGHEYIHATHNFMSSKGVLKASAKHNGILWTEISARHWETHTWGVQNGYGIYERQLGVFSWWRKNYFGWLINAKY